MDTSTTTTRQRITDTAAVLFAQHGYASTTTRQITEEAEVNIAAVNYHFGSKENLLIEVLDGIVGPLNDERLALLDELEEGETPDVEAVLRAFLLPDVRTLLALRDRDPALPRFVSRMYSEGSEFMAQVVGRQFAVTRRRFVAALSRALPELSEDEVLWRLNCVVGIVIHLFAETPGRPPMVSGDLERAVERLVHVSAALVKAERIEEVVLHGRP